jgi:hypothetical protein
MKKYGKMKINRVVLWLGLILPGLFYLAGCSLNSAGDPKVLVGTGPLVDLDVQVDTIESVTQFGYGIFYVKHGNEQKVTIRAQQNILDHIQYGVTNNDFSWGFDGNVSLDPSTDSIVVTCIVTKEIKSINLAGTGAIITEGPRQKRINLQLNGAGSILNYDLPVNICKVTFTGTGVMKVNVSDSLSGSLSGQGYVYYKGKPYVALPVLGTGYVVDDN